MVLSLVLSLTLTPMLCALFLKVPNPPANWFTRTLEKGFRNMEDGYVRALDVVLRHKLLTLTVFLATMAAAVWLYATVPTGFFPQQDTGFLSGVMITSQDASFTKTKQKLQDVAKVLSQDPAVAGVAMFIGSSSANQANLTIALKPKSSGRTATADEVIARLRPKLAELVGVQTFLQAAQDINVGGRTGQAQYQYTLSDPDLTELDTWAPKLLAALKAVPRADGRQFRSAIARPRDQSDHRPRRRRAIRHLAGANRHCDLRPDRPGRGCAILYATKQLPRDRGGATRAAGHARLVQFGVSAVADHGAGTCRCRCS